MITFECGISDVITDFCRDTLLLIGVTVSSSNNDVIVIALKDRGFDLIDGSLKLPANPPIPQGIFRRRHILTTRDVLIQGNSILL